MTSAQPRKTVRARNVVVVAIALALIGAALIATPLLLDWRRAEQLREAEAPDPIVADAQDTQAIVQAVVAQKRFQGVPLAPPEPGEDFARDPRTVLVIADQSLCFAPEPAVESSCSSFGFEYLVGVRLERFAPRRLRRELALANTESHKLELSPMAGARMATRDELAAVFAADSWEPFHQRYPDAVGVGHFSRAVVSHDRQNALVVVGYGCGSMCGGDSLVRLERASNGWRVIGDEPMWTH